MEEALHLAAHYMAFTTVAPSCDEIGRVAAIAAIRTCLTFFLDRDIELDLRQGGSDARRT